MAVTVRGARLRRVRDESAPARRRLRPALVLGASGLALVAAVLAGIWIGAFPLPPGAVVLTLLDRVVGTVTGGEVTGGLNPTGAAVLLELRLPRVILAVLVGAGLACSGAAYQGVFRNALADPYLLGAAAGAGWGRPWSSPTRRPRRWARSASSRWRRSSGRCSASGPRSRSGRLPAARRARRCCWPASPSRRSSPQRRRWCSSRTPRTCGQVYGWLLGQLGRAQWSRRRPGRSPTSAAPSWCCCFCGRALDVLAVGDDEARSLGREPRPAAAAGDRGRLAGHRRGRRRERADRLRRAGRAARRPAADRQLLPPRAARVAAAGRRLPGAHRPGGPHVLSPAELPIGVVTAFIGAPFFAGLLWVGARRR